MITETEQKALQLAKKVFEHFTHDALPIAREIIAMELELEQSPVSGESPDGVPLSIPEIKKTDGQPIDEFVRFMQNMIKIILIYIILLYFCYINFIKSLK